nr:hypothetical protein [Propionibacteriaceae bacterium]
MSATPVPTSQARPRNAGALDQPVRPQRPGKLRAASRAGRHLRPRARPLLPVPAPTRLAASGSAARGCTLPAGRLTTATALASARWRLTDRGIAVILVVSVLIV